MTYQIPQQLEYKEKIMFGLTFKQIAYAVIFGLIALILYKISPLWQLGFILALFSCIIAAGFMFFDFDARIKDYWFFFKFKEVILTKELKDSFFSFLGIKKIEDNLIIDSKGKKIAILKINPINFSIKQNEEKEAIMLAFQKFLNSLDFPTQIIMNTESLELSHYLSALKARIKEKSLIKIFEDYKLYLQKIITEDKIMNRVFYIVIKEQNDIKIQVDVCLERFNALNLRAHRLQTKELEKLILSYIPKGEPPQREKKKESIISKITGLLIKSKKKHKQEKPLVIFESNPGLIKANDDYYRIIHASGYPRTVEPGFLDRIVSSLGDFNLSLHIKPFPIENMIVDVNKELQKQRSDLYSMQLKGIINPSLEIQHSDTRGTLEALQKGKERLFNISLYIVCKSDSEENLNFLTKKIEAELNSIMILPKFAYFRMLKGFRSIVPLGNDELKMNRNITTSALSAFFPFTSQFLQADDTGVWLGLNKNGIPIIKDIFKLPNPNGVVLAQSGGGKSYFCKLLITRYLLNGAKVIIIDPQGEYKGVVKRFNGQIIDLSIDSDTLINPLDLMGHDFMEKRLSLIDLMPIMLGSLSEPQKAFLDKAITEAYSNKGITLDEDDIDNTPPTMSDILASLNNLYEEATQIEKATLRSLINRIEMYVTGVFRFLDRHTNLEFNKDLVCFDLGNMPKQVKPVIMFLLLDYVYMKMKSDATKKILLVDEAWTLLSRTEDASYILEIVKTCRKFNMGLLLINQEVEDLFNSRAGKSVLANSAYTMLLRQKPSVIDKICETFHLSQSEREHLLTAGVGEGLLIMEDEHSIIKVKASPAEHEIAQTKVEEIVKKKRDWNKPKKRINVDLRKGFYKRQDINEDEIKYLLKQGYQEFSSLSINSDKKEDFILKPRFNESATHMFFVYDIADYLKKKGADVQLFTTKMPDIVCEINGKIYAFEIETGSMIENPNRTKEKIAFIKQQGYNGWYFVVTTKHLVKDYKKFGKTIDPRSIKGFIDKIVKKA